MTEMMMYGATLEDLMKELEISDEEMFEEAK
jgi:hypothetical protein